MTTPGEGIFAYTMGTVVNLVAEASEGFRFLNWTGDVETIASVIATITTIIVQGNCSIRANFEF